MLLCLAVSIFDDLLVYSLTEIWLLCLKELKYLWQCLGRFSGCRFLMTAAFFKENKKKKDIVFVSLYINITFVVVWCCMVKCEKYDMELGKTVWKQILLVEVVEWHFARFFRFFAG